MTRIYTATYRYSGADRLDITVKGQHAFGQIFAPNWDMVMGVKQGRITNAQYTERYMNILNNVPQAYYDELAKYPEITLVCFCPKGAFCHRVLLASHLATKGGFEYHGER